MSFRPVIWERFQQSEGGVYGAGLDDPGPRVVPGVGADGAGLVRIEEYQDQIRDLGQVADDLLVVVSPIPLRDAVQHARCVDDGQGLEKGGDDPF